MAPYDEWNQVEDDEDDELQDDVSFFLITLNTYYDKLTWSSVLRREERCDSLRH